MKPQPERVKTSYEQEHDIEPGTESRSDALRETPEQYQERIERDVREGLRAPPPEAVDMSQSTVTQEQVLDAERASAKPHLTRGWEPKDRSHSEEGEEEEEEASKKPQKKK